MRTCLDYFMDVSFRHTSASARACFVSFSNNKMIDEKSMPLTKNV